jgi:hypothetical protein
LGQSALNVRHERHKTRSLNGASKVTLGFGGEAGAATVKHSRVRINVGQKPRNVFVVYVRHGSFLVQVVFFHIILLLNGAGLILAADWN